MDNPIKELTSDEQAIQEFAATLRASSIAMFTRMSEKGFWEKLNVIQEVASEYVYDSEDQAKLDTLLQAIESEKLMLVVGELSEAQEAMRKDKMDDHLPQHHGLAVEVIDAIVRLQDFLGYLVIHKCINVEQVYLDKVAYNANRPHKHGKAF